MPESHLWLLNHVGNTFGLSTKQHKFIQLGNTWNEAVTVKRISSSSWCIWGLGHDHRVYTYVFSSDVPIRVPDTLYENQRYIPFHGFSQSGLLPMDRHAWSDERGVKYTPKESFRLPSAHWSWDGDWMVDENLRGEVAGVEGWQYAVDFPSSHYTPEKHWKSCVRKRKWIRFRRFTSTDVWVRVSDMEVVESSECFIDINIGGFYLPSQPSGFLSVWAVTNTGRVYARTKVCHDQPEGVSWKEISLGSNLGVINICVGASNLVWAITWDGQALVRTGINRNKIYGTQWEVVECPDDTSRLMQVAVGKNVVWALSREGKVWFRKGTCGDDIRGNISSFIGSMWVEMVGDMSCIAVSANDQVFAIDANDGGVYFRTGITSSNLTGKTWQKISLHEDISIFESMMSETCACSHENSQCSGLCEFHKRRAESFTTSCSSTTSTIPWTDEPLSDVFLSPQSPETVPLSTAIDEQSGIDRSSDVFLTPQSPETIPLYTVDDQPGIDRSIVTQQHSSSENDSPSIYHTPTDPFQYRQEIDDREDRLSPSSATPVHDSIIDSNVRKNELSKESVLIVKNTTKDDCCLPKTQQQIQDQNSDSTLCNNSPVNNTPSSDSMERNTLQQTSTETKIQSFVEELTEVDRFLVETEILQSNHASFSSRDVIDSSCQPNICNNRTEVLEVASSSIDDNDEDSAVNRISFSMNQDISSGDNLGAKNHDNETGPKSDTDTSELPKPSKHKHKPKHVKRPDFLPIEDESDSIVYKSPRTKRKKKKMDAKIESHVQGACDELQNETTLVVTSNEDSRLSEQFSQGVQLESSNDEIKETEESSQPNEDIVTGTLKQVNESDNVNVIPGLVDSSRVDSLPAGINDRDKSTVKSFGQNAESTLSDDRNSTREADSLNVNLDCNSDQSFQQNSLEININNEAGTEAIKIDRQDSLPTDGRRFSLDSPVSDRIFDFVSFIEEDQENDANDMVDSHETEVKKVHEVVSIKMSSMGDSSISKENEVSHRLPFGDYKFSKEPPTYSEVMSADNNKQTTPYRAQLIPLQPARKVFHYRTTPSPSTPSQRSSSTPDPQTFSQTRYAWRSLDVSAFHVDDPSIVRWLNFKKKDLEENKNAPKISVALRNDIMTKLKARNRREIYQFHNFEQAVKNTTWVKKSVMKTFVRRGGGHWATCNVELEQSKSDQYNKCLTITQSSKNHQKVKEITLKDVRCVKSSTKPDLIRTTFIIYTSADAHNPLVLQAASESDANEWMSLLCSANASQCNLDQPIPAGSLWSCTKSGAILVSPSNALETKSGDFCWGGHGGHMALIETGSGGVTWGIGFDRLAYVYNGGFGGAVCTDVPGMSSNLQDMTDSHRVYVYEHQMRFPVVGWCSKGVFGNNFNWTTETGQTLASRDDVKLPSSKWQWVSSWTVDFNTSGGVNSEGWQFSTVLGDYHRSQHVRDMYRRRRWVRTSRLNTQGPWMSSGSLSLHDISIQLDPVTSSHDVIVLWAIGTNGDVLCRCGVTEDNPLGQSWIHIPTDLDKPFVSISVGGGWRVWGVAGDGSTWYRSGVSQYSPAGKCWLQVVEPPQGSGILRQASAGSSAVWAVDTEDNLWRRKNITRTFPEGTEWDLVASRVKQVNVGPRDQVWIITDSRFNSTHESSGCIYRRVGITDDRPGGIKWEKVIGEGWSHVSIRGVKDNNVK